ncbi:MAG: hypothetical protein H0U95_02400 [Bacteroidetes bacterium]|nr:hypothetical protein [Bacteroidota bacterium]
MKKSGFILIALLSLSVLNAQTFKTNSIKNKNNTDTCYCLMVKGNIEILMRGKKEVEDDIRLKNGDQLTINGRVMRFDGTEVKLKEGECVTINGVILKTKQKH